MLQGGASVARGLRGLLGIFASPGSVNLCIRNVAFALQFMKCMRCCHSERLMMGCMLAGGARVLMQECQQLQMGHQLAWRCHVLRACASVIHSCLLNCADSEVDLGWIPS